MNNKFKLPMTFKKYCKQNLLFLGKRFDWNKIYNQCLIHYGKEILEQSIKELVQEGKIKKKQKGGTMPRYKTRLYYKTLYNKTKEWLQGEIDNTELTEELCESNDDFLVYGRKEKKGKTERK